MIEQPGAQVLPSATGSGRERVAEVTELAVVDGRHPDVLRGCDVCRGVVDEQALIHWSADPLRSVDIHAGVGFRVADPGGVHNDVCEIVQSLPLQVIFEP